MRCCTGLAVFAGGFDPDGAQAVGMPDEDFEVTRHRPRFAGWWTRYGRRSKQQGAEWDTGCCTRQHALEKLSESGEAGRRLRVSASTLKQPNQVVRAGSGGVRYWMRERSLTVGGN